MNQEEYDMHLKSVKKILESDNFTEFIKDNIYLCFDGNCITNKNEEKKEDSYTNDVIPPQQLKVCVIKNKRTGTIDYSMENIYCFLYANNPELEQRLGTWRYEDGIEKYKSSDYYMEYLSIDQFLELYNFFIINTKCTNDGKTLK